ncbi:unnamed protein product [Periconia digitata]|uniref:Uncharacterized protein n=1 Tax=Periconia digitata TaxID=1303443 RepID=A0A9W4UDB9_9PLEO|nr:unnamed protein product [Periconia digitata]
MLLNRRFTARNGALVLVTGFLAILFLHPRIGLWRDDTETFQAIPSNRDTALKDGKQQDQMTVNGKRIAVVVASQHKDDTAWLSEYFPYWEKHIYMVDDADAKLKVPKNKGRESMVYLTFMIDNYDNLPDSTLFIHPNRYQWHNDDADYDGLPVLRHFQFPYLESEGYVNLRCAWSMGCPEEIKPLDEEGEHRENVHAGGDYKKAFQELFPGKPVPDRVGVSCCAQFALTKEKIREKKKEEYIRLRTWLLETTLADSISGRVLEYSWHSMCGFFLLCDNMLGCRRFWCDSTQRQAHRNMAKVATCCPKCSGATWYSNTCTTLLTSWTICLRKILY